MRKQWFHLAGGMLLLIALLAAPDTALSAARSAVSLIIEVLVPSLLPYLAAGQLLTQPIFLRWCSKTLGRIMPRLFALPGVSASALSLSLACGYPAGARMTGELIRQKLLPSHALQRTAALASHAGPAFIVGSIGTALLGNSRLGMLLWLCHITSALFMELIWNLPHHARRYDQLPLSPSASSLTLADILLSSARTLAFIGSTVIFFSVLLALGEHFGLLRALSDILSPILAPLGISSLLVPALLSGILEMTSGCRAAIESGAAPEQLLPLLSLLLSFGGLSVHVQTLGLLPGLRPGGFILHKTIQALISMLLTRAVLFFFPSVLPAFSPSPVCYVPIGWTQLAALAALCLAALFVMYCLLALIACFTGD